MPELNKLQLWQNRPKFRSTALQYNMDRFSDFSLGWGTKKSRGEVNEEMHSQARCSIGLEGGGGGVISLGVVGKRSEGVQNIFGGAHLPAVHTQKIHLIVCDIINRGN